MLEPQSPGSCPLRAISSWTKRSLQPAPAAPRAGMQGFCASAVPDQKFPAQVVNSYIQSEFASVRTSSSILDLFRTPAIRRVTCCLVGVW